ncbi:MAG: hypothetical protein JXQ99_07565 [Hyphomicrobiaceae bacterium]
MEHNLGQLLTLYSSEFIEFWAIRKIPSKKKLAAILSAANFPRGKRMLEAGRFESARVETSKKEKELSSESLLTGNLDVRTLVIEIVIIYFALFTIDFVFFEKFGDFFALEPHPFWIPVILLSLQYGFSSAIVTATSAIAINWLLLSPEQPLGEPYFAHVIRNSVSPAMWLATALIVGELRQRQISLHAQAIEEVERLHVQAKVLSTHCAETKQANRDLQLKIAAGKTAPIEHALIQLGSDEPRNIKQFLTTFEEALEALVGHHKASIFVINDGVGLHLAFQFGWADSDRYLREIQPSHPLYQTVIEQELHVSSCRSPWDNQVLRGEGEIAVPIKYIHHGKTFGMLKIEETTAGLYSSEKLRALTLLGREMGIFLEQLALQTGGSHREQADKTTPLRAAS